MKKTFCVTIVIILVTAGCSQSRNKIKSGEDRHLTGNISISGAFALYPITVRWAEEFQKEFPDVKIDISAGGAGKGMADALSQMVDLGMFSREISAQEKEKGAWYIALTKDAVLPTINAANPYLSLLSESGLTREQFMGIFVTGRIHTWEELLNISGSEHANSKINVYTRSDACGAAAMWGSYLGTAQEELTGLGVFGDPGVADAVKNDLFGIGYNNVIYVYDLTTRDKYNNLEVIPIDLNADGKIDQSENFYHHLDSVMLAIKSGIYPSPPARELYFVSKGKPEKEVVVKFIEWILTTGQEFVDEAGYVQLSENTIQSQLVKLND